MANDSTGIFNFMSLRAIRQPDDPADMRGVIRDDRIVPGATSQMLVTQPAHRADWDLFSTGSPSTVGKAVYRSVMRDGTIMAAGLAAERALLRGYDGALGAASAAFAPILTRVSLAKGARLGALTGQPSYLRDNALYVMPGTLADVSSPLSVPLAALGAEVGRILDSLVRRRQSSIPLTGNLGHDTHMPGTVMPALVELVYGVETGAYALDFAIAKRHLFDAFYGLYVLRRIYPVRFDPLIEGLQVLHAVEKVAAFLFLHYALATRDNSTEQNRIAPLLQTMAALYGSPVAVAAADADELDRVLDMLALPVHAAAGTDLSPLRAQPVVHPLFSRLSRDLRPFNDIPPVGIGDLMVVRQTFLGYRKGEIAHIETVLAGETKSTVHRRLDRSEVSQTYSSTDESETTRDRQSTSRFELKNEAETVLKTEFGAQLGTNLTYSGSPVVVSVTANANLSLGRSETSRLASNFAREVTEKAVTKVQRRVSEQRSRTVLSETEETNKHKFANTPENGHISGIYRWVDKVYKAEIRNYGRRLMFEFMVPEPSAFFVQQRLLAHAANMALPDFPVKVQPESNPNAPDKPVTTASLITRERWAELNLKYQLDDLPPPADRIDGIPIVDQNGGRIFTMTSGFNDTGVKTDTYMGAYFPSFPGGYEIVSFAVQGNLEYANKNESNPNWQNSLVVRLGNTAVFNAGDESTVFWRWDTPVEQAVSQSIFPVFGSVKVETRTCKSYNLQFSVSVVPTAATFQAWQTRVYDALVPARLRKVENGTPVEDPDMVAFHKALSEIEKPDFVQLIQGKSSAWNEGVIKRELRRQCISQVTREFGADSRPFELTNTDTMGRLGVGAGYDFPDLTVTPGTAAAPQSAARLDPAKVPSDGYRVPDVDLSRRKGNAIQFIEHAFEWEQMSYVFYPYYWATPPRWVDMLSREDDADPAFTEFLQAGAGRVLLAVRPGFEQAVMHYLATREPWDGGAAPVIGDPLHLPVYMEMRGRHDDDSRSERVGDPWVVTVPTSLIYLESKKDELPDPYDPTKPLT